MSVLEDKLKHFPYKIILGSASPRRHELLKGLGFDFTIEPTHANEDFPAELKGEQIPLYLVKTKTNAFSRELNEKEILITADTVVWCEGKIYNKPLDFDDGRKMLRELGGKMHEVFTAICLRSYNKEVLFYDTSRVFFKEFSEYVIKYYLTYFTPYDKAGSYGVQDLLGYTVIN